MKIIRGDTILLSFIRLNSDGQPITSIADAVYFTVKRNYTTEDVILQKRLSDMTFDDETGKYAFAINPEDTDSLNYGKYVYDVEVIVGSYKKTIARGELEITEEVTHVGNEV